MQYQPHLVLDPMLCSLERLFPGRCCTMTEDSMFHLMARLYVLVRNTGCLMGWTMPSTYCTFRLK